MPKLTRRSPRGWRGAAQLAAAGAIFGLTGCATGDRFATRTVHYDTEAEQVQDQAILLNILRASMRRPFSFTELQTVSASATPSGSIALQIPLQQNGSATPSTLSPTLSLSGGPTVTVGYVDTQEFYQGILKPIPLSTIDLLLKRGFSREIVFNLLFAKVVVQDLKGSSLDAPLVNLIVDNYVVSKEKSAAYQRLVDSLLNAGLSTSVQKPETKVFGPPLSRAELADSQIAARGIGAGLQIEKASWCDLELEDELDLARRLKLDDRVIRKPLSKICDRVEKVDKHDPDADRKLKADQEQIAELLSTSNAPSALYRLVKIDPTPRFRLCFERQAGRRTTPAAGVGEKSGSHKPSYCDDSKEEAENPLTADRAPRGLTLPHEADDRLCDQLNQFGKTSDAARGEPLFGCGRDWDRDVTFSLVPRSTYGVMFYLGEVLRQWHAPDDPAGRRIISVKVGPADQAIPAGDCDGQFGAALANGGSAYRCKPIFFLEKDSGHRGFLSVRYDGHLYTVPDDPARAGETTEVLEIVNELLALNRKASDAPTSNVFTVLGAH